MAKIEYHSLRCTGCKACEAACQQEHSLPLGIRWRVVSYNQEGEYPNIRKVYQSSACVHCANPGCLKACPEGAVKKDEDSGIIMINRDLCNGCQECVRACPFQVMVYETENKKVSKCTYCAERTVQGLEPACVSVCMGLALRWKP